MKNIQDNSSYGGARKGAGRKPGVPSKKTTALQQAVAESGITPLDYMLSLVRDTAEDPKVRLSAALGAAPYIHAKLSSIEVGGPNGPLEIVTDIRLIAPSLLLDASR